MTFLECGMDVADPSVAARHDHGSMGIGIFANQRQVSVFSAKAQDPDPNSIFAESPAERIEVAPNSPDQLLGALRFSVTLPPGGSRDSLICRDLAFQGATAQWHRGR